MRDLYTRLPRALIANGKRPAALGVLFLLGCSCWVPMLLRASSPHEVATAQGAALVNRATGLSTTGPSNSIPAHAIPNEIGVGARSSFWKSLSESLKNDPLFHPADLSLATRDPFTIDEAQLPLPVLFANADMEEQAARSDSQTAPSVVPTPQTGSLTKSFAPKLELNSTMVGRTRRVALINGRLYHQGQDVITNGQRYRLASVKSERVLLTAGDQDFVLTMSRPQLRDALIPNDEPKLTQSIKP